MENREIIVSVHMITYNHENYIASAIEGVIIQEVNFPIELIISDDCSTDKTKLIIENYANRNPNLINPIFRDNNIGSMSNFLDTFNYCTGKYIALCEGDDYWIDPYKLQKQVDFLEANPEYLMCCHRSKIEKDGIIIGKYGGYDFDTNLSINDIIKKGGEFIPTTSIVFKSTILSDMMAFSAGSPIGDYPLQIYCGIYGKVFHFYNIMSVYRTQTSTSWSQIINHNKGMQVQFIHKQINWFKSANEYSNYLFDNEFRYVTGERLITLSVLNDDYASLPHNDCVRYFLKQNSRSVRISLYARMYGMNFIHKIYKKIFR